jgi:O-acetyl-ADP-ribose deacetylase
MPELTIEPLRIGRGMVRLLRGDITEQEVDAFVFYARSDLMLGSGYGTIISQRGGPTIQKELATLGTLETGQAVVTAAGKLKASYIVHAVGPRFNESDLETKLRTTVLSALKAAEEKGIKRIALPPMGAGFYGIPLPVCARVMLEAIRTHLSGTSSIEEVTLCVMDSRELTPFQSQMEAMGK